MDFRANGKFILRFWQAMAEEEKKKEKQTITWIGSTLSFSIRFDREAGSAAWKSEYTKYVRTTKNSPSHTTQLSKRPKFQLSHN